MLGYFACDSLYGSVNKGTYFCTDHVVIKVKDVFSLLDRIYVLFQSLGSFFLLVLCIEQVSIGLARCSMFLNLLLELRFYALCFI